MRAAYEQYKDHYKSFAVMSRADGVLEVRLHTNDRPGVFDRDMHSGLGDLFSDIGSDRDNRVVILTGTGDRYLLASDLDLKALKPFLPFTAEVYLPIMAGTRRMIDNFLDIEVPVISAVNGPVSMHAEIPILADVVLASDDAWFSNSFHFINGLVPGDGSHVVWPLLMGLNRARYFLLTGEKMSSIEAKAIGIVNEVMPSRFLLDRAWTIARSLIAQPDVTLRATKLLFTRNIKRAMSDELMLGLALLGLGNTNHFPLTLREVQ